MSSTPSCPRRARTFPYSVDLAHDYTAWYWAMVDAKEQGHQHDWTDIVQPLRTFGSARFEVTDPNGICRDSIGFSVEHEPYATWELASPVSRARVHLPAPTG